MPELSLTDLVDVVIKSGTPKATKISQIKRRPDYEPAFDFYKPLRNRIIEGHQQGLGRTSLDAFITTVTDPKKLQNYPGAMAGYKKWWGAKNFIWHDPPHSTYSSNGCDVRINPELGLEYGGHIYIIKLYFKSQKLQSVQTAIITNLLETVLRGNCTNQEILALLDVRRGRIFPYAPKKHTIAQVDAELAYIAAFWPKA